MSDLIPPNWKKNAVTTRSKCAGGRQLIPKNWDMASRSLQEDLSRLRHTASTCLSLIFFVQCSRGIAECQHTQSLRDYSEATGSSGQPSADKQRNLIRPPTGRVLPATSKLPPVPENQVKELMLHRSRLGVHKDFRSSTGCPPESHQQRANNS